MQSIIARDKTHGMMHTEEERVREEEGRILGKLAFYIGHTHSSCFEDESVVFQVTQKW